MLFRYLIVITLLLLVGITSQAHAIQSCNCVAFRLDDIQDYWLDGVQDKIINTFKEKNTSLTIGIIANYFGEDHKIVNLVLQRTQGKPDLEIANHGWNHERFGTFTEQQQWWLLKQANQKIQNVTGIDPTVFIAPYDSINNDTFAAARENNLTMISANETTEPGPYPLEKSAEYKFPYVSQLGDVNKDSTNWLNFNRTRVHAEILRGIMQYGYAVVVLHPQDFSLRNKLNYTDETNETRIKEIGTIIDEVREDNLKMVTMSQIPLQQKFYERTPGWVHRVTQWYFEGKIPSRDYEAMVVFLRANGLLTVSSTPAYPSHHNISATYFWVGEPASADNGYVSNMVSAWDSEWVRDFGGVDDPGKRNSFMPSGFKPHENPFYVALPYNDFENNGTRNPDASLTYWYAEKNWAGNESIVKNRWVMITKGDSTAYAQWEDAGPFQYDDVAYVFGTAEPANRVNHHAGIDLSPSIWDYLGLNGTGPDRVDWKFIDYADVPDGPWKGSVTTSQVNWQN